jgi:hypothetical protein
MFYLHLFNPVAKKLFLTRKNIGGAFLPSSPTHQSYAYGYGQLGEKENL